MKRAQQVVGHWHKSFDAFSTSALDFYAAVEEAVARRQIPDVRFSRVEHAESGLLSANREYLRVGRGKLSFDVCAAPFGNGFFFSWWLVEPVALGIFYLIGLIGLLFPVLFLSMLVFGIFKGVFLFPFIYVGLVGVLAVLVRSGKFGDEAEVIAMPKIGIVYERVFQPLTYYKLDTETMFRNAVHTAVMEVIERLTGEKGLSPLSPEERRIAVPWLAED
jgi:hypothetical protein